MIEPVGRWKSEDFVGGHPALDLANTIPYRKSADTEDWIARPADLDDWAASQGLAEDLRKSTDEDVALTQATRDAVHAAFAAVASNRDAPPEAIATLLRAAAGHFDKPGAAHIHTLLAWKAVEALTTLPRDRIRECPRCGWLFVDSSRGGRRRWCRMAVCGTHEKMKTYRRNQKDN